VGFNWDVDMFTGYSYEFLSNIAKISSVNSFSGCDTPDIGEKISAAKFDLFIVSGWHLKSYWQAVRACKKQGIPILVRGDSQLDTPRSFIKRMAKEIIYRILLKQFSGFLTVGYKNREYLKHYGVPDNRIFFSPHFIDNDWFQKYVIKSNRTETLRTLGCDPNAKIILFVGKFIEIKRPLDVIRTISALKRKQPDMKFQALFIGDGEMNSRISLEAEALDVSVVLAGFKNQSALPSIYAAADVLQFVYAQKKHINLSPLPTPGTMVPDTE